MSDFKRPVINHEYVEAITEDIEHVPSIVLVQNDDDSLSFFSCTDDEINAKLLFAAASDNDNENFADTLFKVCLALAKLKHKHRAKIFAMANEIRNTVATEKLLENMN